MSGEEDDSPAKLVARARYDRLREIRTYRTAARAKLLALLDCPHGAAAFESGPAFTRATRSKLADDALDAIASFTLALAEDRAMSEQEDSDMIADEALAEALSYGSPGDHD